MPRAQPVLPYAAVLGAIALLSLMDAVMKGASLMIGAYSTLVVRSVFGLALATPLWLRAGTGWPAGPVVRLHLLRGVVVTGMSFTFFWGLTRLPLAEAIAISFTAPLVALYLAALLLGERVGKGAIAASLMGLVGVVVIAAGRMEGDGTPASGWGMAAVLLSSLLYALNLVLQRKQALVARPAEVSAFHQAVVLLSLALFAPWFLERPGLDATLLSAAAAVLSVTGAMIFAWAYRRAETQALAPLEYSGFLWAALFGRLFFGEPVTLPTLAGAGLIVLGCWIAAPRKRPEQSAA
jgi:S-adenosylmethionine uptake transporter